MDLPATTPTLTSREIQVVHLEPTDVCQARCPQCARETDQWFDARHHHHLSVDDVRRLLPDSVMRNLHKMFMCGNYGDPAAGRYTLQLFEYFRGLQPNITLGMNSNGGIGSTGWWRDLAQILNHDRDFVVFSIDGLADTNHFYRINVDWDRLMKNVTAFIDAGGSAHWDMLVYHHNQHQVEQCINMARDLRFRWFRSKVTRRPLVGNLRLPDSAQADNSAVIQIDCHALNEKSIYIDAQARISPCCWLGSRQNSFVTDFEEIQRTWTTNAPNPVCKATCGRGQHGTKFQQQWQQEIQLC